MKIVLAQNIGFCGGVAKAVTTAEKAAEKYGEVQMLGDIVHNYLVVKDLEKKGIHVVKNIEEIDKNKPLLLRAHGTALDLEKKLLTEGYFVIDATCPLVKEIHTKAQELEQEGRQVIIIGDHGHDEVTGIQSRLKNPLIVQTPDEAKKLSYFHKIGIVVQSTQFLTNVQDIVAILSAKCTDLHFVNTLCQPTKSRQAQVVELAKNNELVLIVGSKTSANTQRLAEIARQINPNTYRINSVADLNPDWFQDVDSVGISGGASTPGTVVESIKKSIEKICKNLLN
jgi:4-hydroxy-3-methylbut-2-enyl diphosphate reductase